MLKTIFLLNHIVIVVHIFFIPALTRKNSNLDDQSLAQKKSIKQPCRLVYIILYVWSCKSNGHLTNPSYFLILTQWYVLLLFYREMKGRGGEREREKDWLIDCPLYNPQSGIEPTTFWCMGQHFIQLNHLTRAKSQQFLQMSLKFCFLTLWNHFLIPCLFFLNVEAIHHCSMSPNS